MSTITLVASIEKGLAQLFKEAALNGIDPGTISKIRIVHNWGSDDITDFTVSWYYGWDYEEVTLKGSITTDKVVTMSEVQVIVTTPSGAEVIIAKGVREQTLYAFHTYEVVFKIRYYATDYLFGYFWRFMDYLSGKGIVYNLVIHKICMWTDGWSVWRCIENRPKYNVVCIGADGDFPCYVEALFKDDSREAYEVNEAYAYNPFDDWLFDIYQSLTKDSDNVLEIPVFFEIKRRV